MRWFTVASALFLRSSKLVTELRTSSFARVTEFCDIQTFSAVLALSAFVASAGSDCVIVAAASTAPAVSTSGGAGGGDVGTTTGLGDCSAASSSASRSEEHTSELQSLMRISYAVFCLKKKK